MIKPSDTLVSSIIESASMQRIKSSEKEQLYWRPLLVLKKPKLHSLLTTPNCWIPNC